MNFGKKQNSKSKTMKINRKTTIAIILNLFVMPGLGHIYMGFKMRGAVIAGICAFFLIAVIAKYMLMMSYALNVMSYQGTNPLQILFESAAIVWPEMRSAVLLGIAGILLLWGFSIIDIYNKGKTLEVKNA